LDFTNWTLLGAIADAVVREVSEWDRASGLLSFWASSMVSRSSLFVMKGFFGPSKNYIFDYRSRLNLIGKNCPILKLRPTDYNTYLQSMFQIRVTARSKTKRTKCSTAHVSVALIRFRTDSTVGWVRLTTAIYQPRVRTTCFALYAVLRIIRLPLNWTLPPMVANRAHRHPPTHHLRTCLPAQFRKQAVPDTEMICRCAC